MRGATAAVGAAVLLSGLVVPWAPVFDRLLRTPTPVLCAPADSFVAVTGISSGLGRDAADALARAGYTVLGTVRKPGGKFAAVRFQEPEAGTATVIFVDLEAGEVISEVTNLLPYVWVDPETGFILQPAKGGAILEMDMHGAQRRIFRVLPEGEWVCFGPAGILDASSGAQF